MVASSTSWVATTNGIIFSLITASKSNRIMHISLIITCWTATVESQPDRIYPLSSCVEQNKFGITRRHTINILDHGYLQPLCIFMMRIHVKYGSFNFTEHQNKMILVARTNKWFAMKLITYR